MTEVEGIEKHRLTISNRIHKLDGLNVVDFKRFKGKRPRSNLLFTGWNGG